MQHESVIPVSCNIKLHFSLSVHYMSVLQKDCCQPSLALWSAHTSSREPTLQCLLGGREGRGRGAGGPQSTESIGQEEMLSWRWEITGAMQASEEVVYQKWGRGGGGEEDGVRHLSALLKDNINPESTWLSSLPLVSSELGPAELHRANWTTCNCIVHSDHVWNSVNTEF